MLEIQPILPSVPIVRAQKINRDDNHEQKQPAKKQQNKEKQNTQPAQHIDEIV